MAKRGNSNYGPLVWIDCEMTGLDLKRDLVIEIACFVTDSNLKLVDQDGFERVVSCPKEILDCMNEWCVEHHGQSGLTDKVLASTATLAQVEEELIEYLRVKCGVDEGKGVLTGNSVHMDKEFLRKDMPKLIDYLHYRIVDVSTIKELAKRRDFHIYANAPKKQYNHTAKSDILESIEELQYYYDTWLLPRSKSRSASNSPTRTEKASQPATTL
ncbi:ribonuclease H-like domain-containing protein [Lipomyces oligophaga]|uniref:ribonuclease H-like domain-containing protein n=1 Tax=Lipomyces oligophaga TaxID=45792 RepID=UPI0034CE16CC